MTSVMVESCQTGLRKNDGELRAQSISPPLYMTFVLLESCSTVLQKMIGCQRKGVNLFHRSPAMWPLCGPQQFSNPPNPYQLSMLELACWKILSILKTTLWLHENQTGSRWYKTIMKICPRKSLSLVQRWLIQEFKSIHHRRPNSRLHSM